MIFEYISRPEIMALLGLIAHGLKKIMRVRRDGNKQMTPLQYLIKYPYQILAALIGVVAGLGALHELNQLNGVSAFAVGYMANSVADMLGRKNVLSNDQPKDE